MQPHQLSSSSGGFGELDTLCELELSQRRLSVWYRLKLGSWYVTPTCHIQWVDFYYRRLVDLEPAFVEYRAHRMNPYMVCCLVDISRKCSHPSTSYTTHSATAVMIGGNFGLTHYRFPRATLTVNDKLVEFDVGQFDHLSPFRSDYSLMPLKASDYSMLNSRPNPLRKTG